MTNMRYAQKVYSFASPVSSKLHSFVCFLPQFDYSWGRPLDTDRTLCDILDCITASLHHPQQVSCKMPKKWAVGPLSSGGCIPNIFTQVIPGIRKRKLGKTQCGKLPLATPTKSNLEVGLLGRVLDESASGPKEAKKWMLTRQEGVNGPCWSHSHVTNGVHACAA